MAIVHASSGAGNGTETSGASLDLTAPATVNANDILIAHVIHTGTSTAPSTPADWTLLYGPADVGTTATARHWVFGKLADGTEDSAVIGFGTAGGTNGRAGRIYRFTGWSSGTLAGVVPSVSFSSVSHATDPQGPTVTTTVAGALAIACACQDDNNAEEAITGMSGGTWGGHTEYSNGTWGPQGIVLYLNTCTPTGNPGTVTGGAMVAANDEAGTIGFEIRPNPLAYTLTAASGSYAVFEPATSLRYFHLNSDVGSYSIIGSPSLRAITINAISGSYNLNGTAVTFSRSFVVAASSGSYSVTGTAATLRPDFKLTATTGSYSLSGINVTLSKGVLFTSDSGSYTLTGTVAPLRGTFLLFSASGAYIITGAAATLRPAFKIDATTTLYTLTGTASNLLATGGTPTTPILLAMMGFGR